MQEASSLTVQPELTGPPQQEAVSTAARVYQRWHPGRILALASAARGGMHCAVPAQGWDSWMLWHVGVACCRPGAHHAGEIGGGEGHADGGLGGIECLSRGLRRAGGLGQADADQGQGRGDLQLALLLPLHHQAGRAAAGSTQSARDRVSVQSFAGVVCRRGRRVCRFAPLRFQAGWAVAHLMYQQETEKTWPESEQRWGWLALQLALPLLLLLLLPQLQHFGKQQAAEGSKDGGWGGFQKGGGLGDALLQQSGGRGGAVAAATFVRSQHGRQSWATLRRGAKKRK